MSRNGYIGDISPSSNGRLHRRRAVDLGGSGDSADGVSRNVRHSAARRPSIGEGEWSMIATVGGRANSTRRSLAAGGRLSRRVPLPPLSGGLACGRPLPAPARHREREPAAVEALTWIAVILPPIAMPLKPFQVMLTEPAVVRVRRSVVLPRIAGSYGLVRTNVCKQRSYCCGGACPPWSAALGCLLHRARSVSRPKLLPRAVGASRRFVGLVDESATGSVNFCPDVRSEGCSFVRRGLSTCSSCRIVIPEEETRCWVWKSR